MYLISLVWFCFIFILQTFYQWWSCIFYFVMVNIICVYINFIFVDLVGLRETYFLNWGWTFHWCWTFGVKNNMGLVFSSWNLSSLCHVICVVIKDFNMSLELFVVPCIKMISNLLLGYTTRLFYWILNWCCKFYHFQKINMKAFFV